MDNERQNFLKYWFSGFIKGLKQIDERSQYTILDACGLACAQSYTLQQFREAKTQSNNLQHFLEILARKFPEASYKYIHPNEIEVCYHECACDLVKFGWIDSPLLCKCSVKNLQQNFEEALGRPVQVELKSSILSAAKTCLFKVVLPE
ncbi:hypothetical protein JW964_13090 [candidate division KSB1 bacterium]|nr:hypothetical protein [candidate division KSB1 bacterium]